MKKKIFVAIIAIAVVAAIVGSAFAAYSKNADTVHISLGTGDAVTLTMNTDKTVTIAAFSPATALSDRQFTVTLNANRTDLVDDGIVGQFSVAVAAASASENDVALAAAIDVQAGWTISATAHSATKSELASGVQFELDSLPVGLTLTFAIAAADFDEAVAAGQVTVTLVWTTIDTWTPDADAYYVVGTMNDWTITKDCLVLSTDPAIKESNTAALWNVPFSAGDEFKVRKGDGTWYSVLGGDAVGNGVSIGTGDSNGNAVVGTAGNYCIYQNGGGFYVGPER